MMDHWDYLWFEYLNSKLDLILHRLDNPTSAKIRELKGHVDAKTAELKAAVEKAQATKDEAKIE